VYNRTSVLAIKFDAGLLAIPKMIKTTLPMKRAISAIVKTYRRLQRRRAHPLSFRDFAAALSGVLEPIGGTVSHQTVKNWEDETHIPKAFTMKLLVSHGKNNWQKDFAGDVLAVLHPEEYAPATGIGKEAIERIGRERMQASVIGEQDSIAGAAR
jgi:hypothetical protein